MNILQKFVFCASLLWAAACTNETELAVPDTPQPDGGTPAAAEREVLLTLDNPFQANTTRAEGIATKEENRINSLDVYVFASPTENGVYSFQELLYYREDASLIIEKDWAKAFRLLGSDDNQSASGVLKLKKGLFIKLYCIANQTTLRVPDAGVAEGFSVIDIDNPGNYFVPVAQSNPGGDDNEVTPGKPLLSEFEQFTTPLIAPNDADNPGTLTVPLAMVDNSNTALDLRDISASARLKQGFRLSRLAVRFDVVNAAKDIKNPDGTIKVKGSRFTITNIYMVNGRPASSFFPIQANGNLITYPKTAVEASLQVGRVEGCFYSYPCSMDDGAYLVLEGKYQVNQTESKTVSYPVYFKDAANEGRYLEIENNHRYTINITAADDYELHFLLQVADWNGTADLDDYHPDNTLDKDTPIAIEDVTGTISVNAATGAIEVTSPAAGNTFAFSIAANSLVTDELFYNGGDEWLVKKVEEEETPTRAEVVPSTTTRFVYEVAAGVADMTNLRPVTIKLANAASGNSREIEVVPVFPPDPPAPASAVHP